MKKRIAKIKLGGWLLILGLIACPRIAAASNNLIQKDIILSRITDDTLQDADLKEEPQEPNSGEEIEEEKPEDTVLEIVPIPVAVKRTDFEEKRITLSWELLQDVSNYTVMCKTESGWETAEQTGDNQAVISLDCLGEVQIYKLCAYDGDGVLKGESNEFEILIPDKPGKLYTTSLSNTKVEIYWDAAEGATAYQVYVKKGKEGYKLSKTVDEPELRFTVKEKENYHFRIVPFFESQIGKIEGKAAETEFKNQEFVSLARQKYSYQQMSSDIKALCKKYSEYVSYETIGKSEQGRYLYDVILGNPEAENTILVVSTLHGREYIATAVCMKQLEFYLQNYNKTVDGKKLSDVFDDCNVHYIMMANPDGVTISQTKNAKWKGNANGVNLNRNFPYRFRKEGNVRDNSYSGKKAESESETKAIVALTKKLKKTQRLAVVNYHAMGNIVFGDYGGKKASLKKDIKKMYQIARSTTGYADASGYGGKSYGNYREYLSYKLEVPSITLEMGSVPCPVPQYQYASAFGRNKLLVLREAKWLGGN